MSDETKIKAESRTEVGKGEARRIRRSDKVPAVHYGHGNDPIHVTLPGHETMLAIKHGGSNALLYLDIDGKEHLALTKQIQSDPIKGFIEHIDFVEVRKGEKVTVDVSIHLVGEALPGSLVVTENTTVSLEAEATNIPEFVELSIEGADVGTQYHASDLVLPSGSLLLSDDDMMVVNVTHAPTEEEVEAELEEAEAEVGIERDESDEEIAEAEAAAAEGKGDSEGESSDEGSSDRE